MLPPEAAACRGDREPGRHLSQPTTAPGRASRPVAVTPCVQRGLLPRDGRTQPRATSLLVVHESRGRLQTCQKILPHTLQSGALSRGRMHVTGTDKRPIHGIAPQMWYFRFLGAEWLTFRTAFGRLKPGSSIVCLVPPVQVEGTYGRRMSGKAVTGPVETPATRG